MISVRVGLAGVTALFAGVAGGTGCAECDAECSGPAISIGVGAAADHVEVCQDGACTTVEVTGKTWIGSEAVRGVFVLVAAGADDHVAARIRVLGSDGNELAVVEVDDELPHGNCGCTGAIDVVTG